VEHRPAQRPDAAVARSAYLLASPATAGHGLPDRSATTRLAFWRFGDHRRRSRPGIEHRIEEQPGNQTKERGCSLSTSDCGQHRGAELAGGYLAVIAVHPVDRCRMVDRERRFVQRDPTDRRQGERRLKRDDRSRAQAEDIVRAGGGQQGVEVLAFLIQALAVSRRPAASPAAAIRNVDGECIRQRLSQPGEVLRGLRPPCAAMIPGPSPYWR
jgi:hypothetical protein